ncbi:MAG: DUF45 domain-containing protein [Patescibacteria group bacterium]|nr:DUF45 domain-containing protein [Patescibacteria group bacterium]
MKIQSKIIRSNRRSIALEIHPNATLIIRAPWFITKHAIENFIQKKHSWIEKKMRIAKARSQVSPKKFITNEIFSYLGKSYQLKIDDKIKPTPSVISDKLVISTKQSAKASKILTSWYK